MNGFLLLGLFILIAGIPSLYQIVTSHGYSHYNHMTGTVKANVGNVLVPLIEKSITNMCKNVPVTRNITVSPKVTFPLRSASAGKLHQTP